MCSRSFIVHFLFVPLLFMWHAHDDIETVEQDPDHDLQEQCTEWGYEARVCLWERIRRMIVIHPFCAQRTILTLQIVPVVRLYHFLWQARAGLHVIRISKQSSDGKCHLKYDDDDSQGFQCHGGSSILMAIQFALNFSSCQALITEIVWHTLSTCWTSTESIPVFHCHWRIVWNSFVVILEDMQTKNDELQGRMWQLTVESCHGPPQKYTCPWSMVHGSDIIIHHRFEWLVDGHGKRGGSTWIETNSAWCAWRMGHTILFYAWMDDGGIIIIMHFNYDCDWQSIAA